MEQSTYAIITMSIKRLGNNFHLKGRCKFSFSVKDFFAECEQSTVFS